MNPDNSLDLGATIRGFSVNQKVFGRYTLKKILGRGGMGVVWLAQDGELDREVALKFLPEIVALDPEALGDLKRETRRNLDLTHAHIVRIYDFVTDARAAAISMEYVDGATLSTLKIGKPERALSVEELKPWLEQLCAALHYAHTKAKIVHRDLKPANLMVNRQGDLKITDFGIARGISDSVSRVSKQAGSSGTPIYMSPQQMMGDDPAVVDDIYALGATIFELLVGKPPFHTGNIIAQVQSKEAPLVNERRAEAGLPPVPPVWEQTIAACLAKVPAERPASANELWRRLDGGAVAASAMPSSAPAPRPAPVIKPELPVAAPTPVALFPAAVAAVTNTLGALLAFGGIILWPILYNMEAWRGAANVGWTIWSLLAVTVAYGLTAARFPLRRAAGLWVLLAGSAILLQEIHAAVFPDEGAGMTGRGIFFAYGSLIVFGAIGSGVLGFLVPGSNRATKSKMVFGGILAAFLGSALSWLVLRFNIFGDGFLLQPGLAVVLCVLAGLVPWTVAEPRVWSPKWERSLGGALPVAAALLGTIALEAFWHRGAVYHTDWATMARWVESAVWLLWCILSFGLIGLQAASRAGHKIALAAGVAFAAGGLLFRESYSPGNGEGIVVLPGPDHAIFLGVGLMVAGLLARCEGRPSVRQWLLTLGAGLAAGLTGYVAAQLPWPHVSWESLASYQVWYAQMGTGVMALLLWVFLPGLEKRGAATTGKQ
jgi:hypothetical protein